MSFRKFLKSRIRENSSIGDLARDAVYDRGWKGWSVNSLRRRFYTMGIYGMAWKTLEEAAEEFERDRKQNNKPVSQSKTQAEFAL